MAAISHANAVLDWQENLLPEEMPPEWMWPFVDELEIWFEEVDTKRKERYGGTAASDEEGSMMRNELARDLR